MRPLRLEIQGLYSYRRKAVIDFRELTQAKLFGIFGTVGSGKSAILEAMSYVLYGQTERMNQQDQRAYNMMNLQSDRLFIEYEFALRGERYLFTVSAQRNKKRFQEIQNARRGAYRWEDGQWKPLPEGGSPGGLAAQGVLGLSYENFRRTIIIPQGKFQEFLQLGKTDRVQMLEELFGLERFNLSDECAGLIRENRDEELRLTTLLKGLEEVTPEGLAERESLREERRGSQARRQEVLLRLKEEEGRWQERFRLSQEEEAARRELAQALETLRGMEEREGYLLRVEAARRDFAPSFRLLEEYRSDASRRQDERAAGRERLAALEAELAELAVRADQLAVRWDRREDLRERCRALRKLAEGRRRQEEARALAEGAGKLAGEVEGLREEEERRRLAVREERAALEKLKGRLLSAEALTACQGWISRDGHLEELLGRSRDAREQRSRELAGLLGERRDLLESGGGLTADWFRRAGGTGAAEGAGDAEGSGGPEGAGGFTLAVLERIKELAAGEVEAARRGREAVLLAAELEDGKPCPVCGSLEHPRPAEMPPGGSDSSGGPGGSGELAGAEEARRDFHKVEGELRNNLLREEALRENLDRAALEEAGYLAALEEHRRALPEGILPESRGVRECRGAREYLAALLEEQRRLELEVRQAENRLAGMEKDLETFRENFKDREEAARRAESLGRENLAAVSAVLEEIPRELRDEKDRSSGEEILAEAQAGEEELAALETDREAVRERLARLGREKAGLENAREQLDRTLRDLDGRISREQAVLEEKLAASPFGTLEEIAPYLEEELSPEEEREQIRRWKIRAANGEKLLADIQKKQGETPYDQPAHQKVLEELAAAEEENRTLLGETAVLDADAARFREDLERKTALEAEFAQCRGRRDNLEILAKLFKARGFVNYVSTLRLRELIDRANRRFEILCGKSLRLELGEDNSFVVRDYLNGGKIRSVKTLSGGQTFQAAFSLALALADAVNRRGIAAGAAESFFFLDEGFGSLDRDSLGIVMETLRSLGDEDRTVGVISHVEELKQEIPTCLTVARDEELGSLIHPSWEA